MPTTRPRHLVTETDRLARALDAAAVRWPDLSRPKLLVRLVLEADASAGHARIDERHRRLDVIHRHSGSATGVYGPDYLDELRNDWPA